MAEPTYRWVNVYDNSVALHNTRGAADVLGYSRRRCDRYRVDNGILVYDPEPVSRHVDSLRWIAVDSGNNFRVLTGFVDGEKPAHGDDEFAVVCRVRDKAADEELVKHASDYGNLSAQVATLTRERDEAREHHRRLIRERDEAIKARDDWQMSAEWGWSDVGNGTELLKKAEDRIAELERQAAEKPGHELYHAVADFLDAVEPGWMLSSMADNDFAVFQVRAEIDGRRVTCYGRSLPEACRKWLDHRRASLAAQEKTDG